MVESSSPRSAAVVAAPMRRLCPVEFLASSPAVSKAERSFGMNQSFVHGLPSWHMKSGPGVCPRTARNANTAATGHMSSSVFPM